MRVVKADHHHAPADAPFLVKWSHHRVAHDVGRPEFFSLERGRSDIVHVEGVEF